MTQISSNISTLQIISC